MALTDEQKKALVERLRLARAKKAAEKKKNPELASDKPAPKKKRVPVVVEEGTMHSAPSAPIIQPQPAPLDLPEPMDHPLYKVPEVSPTVTTGANGEPKKTKTKFMKVVWYKEPTKKQMKALEKIAEDDVSDAEGTESDASDESLPPPPVLPAPTKSKPRAIPTPRAKPAPQVDERQEYLKRMAAMYFN